MAVIELGQWNYVPEKLLRRAYMLLLNRSAFDIYTVDFLLKGNEDTFHSFELLLNSCVGFHFYSSKSRAAAVVVIGVIGPRDIYSQFHQKYSA